MYSHLYAVQIRLYLCISTYNGMFLNSIQDYWGRMEWEGIWQDCKLFEAIMNIKKVSAILSTSWNFNSLKSFIDFLPHRHPATHMSANWKGRAHIPRNAAAYSSLQNTKILLIELNTFWFNILTELGFFQPTPCHRRLLLHRRLWACGFPNKKPTNHWGRF